MRIQHNITAMNSYRTYSNNTSKVSKNLEKLSSGYKINRAGDDAAGLAISEKMRVQITGLEQAQQNAKSGISLVQTAEGALTEVHDMLNRMYTLAEQSANGTYSNELDREQLQKEVSSLRTEINRIADSTNYNGINLLDGSLGGGVTSADGATFTGKEIAKYTAAQTTVATANWSSGVTSGVDTFVIDGQTLKIDWENGDKETKEVFAALAKDHSSDDINATRDLATKLTALFNDKMAENGLQGEVKVTANAEGELKFESLNKTYASEFSFAGTDNGTPTESIGGKLWSSAAGESKEVKATQTYNGDTIVAADDFGMTINGVQVKVTNVAAAKGTDTMDTVATSLENAIKTSVGSYNTAMGLTDGVYDEKSGLTGLKADDFSVDVENGAFKITYNGDQEVTFSFSDLGEKTNAAALGLVGGSSLSGGAQGLTLQIGDTSETFNKMTVAINDMHARAMGIGSIDISSQDGASQAMKSIKSAVNYVSDVRGDLGALQNRLDHTINNLGVMQENIQDAESVIRDTDVAQEMMNYTKNNILVQSAQAMLAQANQLPQGVLQLLQ